MFFNSKHRKNKSSSAFSKLILGGAAFVGGTLLGKYISEKKSKITTATTSQIKTQKEEQKVTNKNIEQYDSLQELMTCPISGQLMTDPVIIKQCGHTYEKKDIEEWIRKQQSCPLCKQTVHSDSLQTNFQLRQVVRMYQKQKQSTKGQNLSKIQE